MYALRPDVKAQCTRGHGPWPMAYVGGPPHREIAVTAICHFRFRVEISPAHRFQCVTIDTKTTLQIRARVKM